MADLALPANLLDRLRELESRVARVERSPRLPSAAIHGGALVVRNDDGDEVVRAGLQEDGSYDVASIDAGTGEAVFLRSLARGVETATLSTPFTLANPGGWSDATPSAGPSVTVTIGPSGRAWVLAGCEIDSGSEAAWHGGRIAFALSGANTRAAEQIGKVYAQSGDRVIVASSGGRLLEGLNPGATTFTLKYGTATGSAATAGFEDGWLLVQPF